MTRNKYLISIIPNSQKPIFSVFCKVQHIEYSTSLDWFSKYHIYVHAQTENEVKDNINYFFENRFSKEFSVSFRNIKKVNKKTLKDLSRVNIDSEIIQIRGI